MISLSSDVALVPKDPAPVPGPHPVRTIPCPLCWVRQPELHPCQALGGSEVILGVGYADSSMRVLLAP
jgi:hypothetical protein